MNIKRKLLALAGAVVAGVCLWSVPAQAASGVVLNQSAVHYGGNPGLYSFLDQTFTAGDCWQGGSPQPLADGSSYVVLSPPQDGVSAVVWNATLGTRHTSSRDIWHATFVFKTAFGTPIATAKLDGPGMVQDQTYRWVKTAFIRVDPALFNAISRVDWYGDC